MNISTIFFDLDGTLYPHNNGMWSAISENMNRFIIDNLKIDPEKVSALRENYFLEYGTTLRGLQDNFDVDAEDYLAYVHDLPLDKFLAKDKKLDSILSELPQNKWILTNSDYRHSNRVLNELGIGRHFMGIIDVWATDFLPKPNPFAFEKALEIAGETSGENCIFIDDIPKNITQAKNHSIHTVLVGENSIENRADFHIKSIHDLLLKIPHLSEQK